MQDSKRVTSSKDNGVCANLFIFKTGHVRYNFSSVGSSIIFRTIKKIQYLQKVICILKYNPKSFSVACLTFELQTCNNISKRQTIF
jgi:hypothetical protein